MLEEKTITPTTSITKVYSYGSSLISQTAITINGVASITYYASDGHGSVREVIDISGATAASYDYDAYGKLLYSFATISNDYTYTGEQWDSDLNLLYNRARYLNLDIGRFWSQDTIGGLREEPQSLHKFVYTYSNPVTYTDRSGKYVDPTDFFIDGLVVHRNIGRDFAQGNLFRLANYYTIGAGIALLSMGQTAKEAAIVIEGLGLKPDLVDVSSREVWEIKTDRSLALAKVDLELYLGILNLLMPDYRWHAGTSYSPPAFVYGLLGRRAYTSTPEPGIILYTPYVKGEHVAAGAIGAAALYALSTKASQAAVSELIAAINEALVINTLAPGA